MPVEIFWYDLHGWTCIWLFFFKSKSNCIKKAWVTPESVHEVYKATRPKGEEKSNKISYLQPNQSIKSKMDHEVQST